MTLIIQPKAKEIVSRIVRVPYKTGETAVLKVTENAKGDIVEIAGKVMKKGKEVGEINYHNKKGFSFDRLFDISRTIEEKAKEGFGLLTELINQNKNL